MIVAARGIDVAYADRAVLRDLTVELDEGDQLAVTGRSGSGKTTLLLVLAGLLTPTAGTVDLRVTPRDVIYVPQAPSLLPELSALQNATLGLRVRGVAPDVAHERAREQLRILGLDDADDALPAELSGGMQQRVALARVLAVAPRLLLADEPTGTLDQLTGTLVLDALQAHAARTGATIVVATHDPLVATRFSSQLAIAAQPSEDVAR
jgi:putative ABC transport system ATP-binding protein